jgi:site-specific DNA-methyltransferase (adenine-specific)
MVAFQAAMTPVFEEALRVAKPGAHLLCFGGTRTFHRMASAIEDAGWEIRDTIMWVYGSGFPKSMDVAKAIDKSLGAERENVPNPLAKQQTSAKGTNSYGDFNGADTIQPTPASDSAKQWDGWGTCLKPAWEPIIVARKPLDGTVAHNVLAWGVGALNIDACRVPTEDGPKPCVGNGYRAINDKNAQQGYRPNTYSSEKSEYVPNKLGRFPANLVHDGSQMVLDLFPQSKGQQGDVTGNEPSHPADGVCYGEYNGKHTFAKRGDTSSAARFFNELRDGEESADRTYTDRGGTNFAAKPGKRREPTSADRFFYCAKASKKDRGEGNNHPTVKPTALMEWLVKLVTPEGGVVLDPFMGSGTTGVACANLGRRFVGIEREWPYMQIAGPRGSGREREMGMFEHV